MDFFKKHFTKMPADVQRTGLGRWFEILEERFMDLFWANLATLICLLPAVICFVIMMTMKDFRWWIPGMIFMVCASPAITAMHSVCLRIVLRMHYWIWDEYKNAAKKEWKSSALLTIMLGIFWSAFIMALYMVWTVEGRIPLFLLVIFAVYGYFLTGITMFSYQLISVVDLPLRYILKDSLLLIFAGKMRSVFSIFLLIVCVIFGYCQGFFAGIIAVVGGLAIVTMSTCLINETSIKRCLK